MTLKLKNNALGNLAVNLSANDTMIRLKAGQGAKFPELLSEGDWFPLALADDAGQVEHTRATSRIGDTIIVLRGQEGSVSRDYSAGDPAYLPLTTGALNELIGAAGPLSLMINDTVVDT